MITYQYMGKRGRLGNQMFQYATLYSIAKENNYEYGIPFLKNVSQDDYQHLCLKECFKNISAKDSSGFVPSTQIQEQTNLFIPSLFNIKDDSDLFGYFQTEKYFKKYKTEILNEFTFKDEIIQKITQLKSNLKTPLISVHMRFGDYEILSNIYPRPTENFYNEAFKLLPEDGTIVLFSDNLNKASSYFNSIKKPYIVFEGLNKYEDMCFMSLCDYHVITNSSFSWWGSWLSQSKLTIAPKEWYGDASGAPTEWYDIYAEGWQVI